MRILFNGKFSFLLTFIFHWIILDFIWTQLETILYGHTVPSVEDSIINIIVVTYVTYVASIGKNEQN